LRALLSARHPPAAGDNWAVLCDHSGARDHAPITEEHMFRRRDRRDDDPKVQDAEIVEEGELDGELDGEDLEDQPEDMDADLDAQAADYLADNDAWMYGPNAAAVIEILDRLEDVGPAEARPIADAWLEIPKSDRVKARKAVRKIHENDAEAARHLQLAREAIGTWMAVAAGYPEHVKSEPEWARICTQTGEAAMDAATASILEDALEEEDFEALYEPWSEATALLDEAAEAAGAGLVAEPSEGEAEGEEAEVDEELEAEDAAFGPNSDAVGDFLNRLWLLTPEQVGRLVGAWQNVSREELKKAHAALSALVDEEAEYRDQVRAAQDKLGPWLNATRVSETAGFLGQAGQGESRKMAGPALADAIAALVLGDLLEPADAESLYGPWFNLIGAPPLPEPADEVEEEPEPPKKPAAKAAAKPAAKPVAKGSTKK
jgi:hypothetical protein